MSGPLRTTPTLVHMSAFELVAELEGVFAVAALQRCEPAAQISRFARLGLADCSAEQLTADG